MHVDASHALSPSHLDRLAMKMSVIATRGAGHPPHKSPERARAAFRWRARFEGPGAPILPMKPEKSGVDETRPERAASTMGAKVVPPIGYLLRGFSDSDIISQTARFRAVFQVK